MISKQQSVTLFCLLMVLERVCCVRSWCELLWLHLYLDIFLPTHFQGWLLNKKIKWRAKSLCKRGEQGGKGRGESKPIRWAASYDMTTAACVSVCRRPRRRQWRMLLTWGYRGNTTLVSVAMPCLCFLFFSSSSMSCVVNKNGLHDVEIRMNSVGRP